MRAPQKYVQGKDSLLDFHKEMKELGKKWLFICSNSGYKACHDKLEKSFEGTEDVREYEIFGGVSSVGEIERMRKLVREGGIEVVVGVGGGSAIDTAKATAYYEGLPVVIVPTVVATDAPCTGLSVIYNDDKSFNSYLFYPKNPEAVIVDSDIIAHAPVSFLVSGMGDALGTFFELGKELGNKIEESMGIKPTLINPYYITGIDEEMLEELKKEHDIVITLEDGILDGGFGEKITRFYGRTDMKVFNYGLKKEFLDRYHVEDVLKENHLTVEQIIEDLESIK